MLDTDVDRRPVGRPAGWGGDDDRRYRAVRSRDARFDGWFFVAVTSTGIYCRPSCPSVTPKQANVRFFPSAAAAQRSGFRACRRCRPDALPGSPEWNVRADLAGRAMRLIADGVVDREGVDGLARRLAVGQRHLHRILVTELGAGPLALARAQRANTARILIETTALPFTDIAFASGFASIRQFNETVRSVFAASPTSLRAAAGTGRAAASPGSISVSLPVRRPFDGAGLLRFLGERAVPGVEELGDEQTYRRVVSLPRSDGVIELTADHASVHCRLALTDLRDLGAAVERCRRLLDLDADPEAVDHDLAADPLLAPAVTAVPGRRVPGCVDGHELAVRAVLGQQVSVAGARTIAGRLVAALGQPLGTCDGSLTHRFPSAAAIADADPALFPMPAARRRALQGLAAALADGDLALEPGVERSQVRDRLLAMPGIGPWTADYIAMRALGDPDAFLPTDLGARQGAARLGGPGDAARLVAHAAAWRPWRSYALQHLWAAAGDSGSRRPAAAGVPA